MQEQTRFAWVTRYLAGLSAGQKFTAAALIIVMIATGVWFGAITSRNPKPAVGWEPVLDQPFTEAIVSSITERLRARSIPCEVRDGKVFVPADKKLDALSDLYYSAVLTGPAEGGFDARVKQMSAWDAPSKTDKLFNRARETMVQEVISRFHGVRKATVLIDPTNERHISGSIVPTAMVDIQTHGSGANANPRQLSSAAVNVLTGAVANLSSEHVKITIDGASYNAGAADLAADDLLAHKQQCEQMYVGKVRQLLSYIPDVLVSVSVDLNHPPAEPEKRAEAPAPVAADGPVIANAVPTIAPAPAVADTTVKPRPPAEKETVRSASVVVPRSYFVGLYKRANRKEMEPDDALLAPIVAAHLVKIRGLVKNSLGVEDDSDVSVELYEDATSAAAPVAAATGAPVTPASAATPASTFAPRLDRQIIYGLLGIMALMVLSALFRRPRQAAPVLAPVRKVAVPHPPAQVLDGTLEGGERAGLDDEEVEAHDMFRRVRDIVEENPDDAARVLRGWIYQGR